MRLAMTMLGFVIVGAAAGYGGWVTWTIGMVGATLIAFAQE